VVAEGGALVTALAAMVWQRKLWWMVPLLLALVLVGSLLFLAQATPLGPLIYPLF
jgi:hypothetical protein